MITKGLSLRSIMALTLTSHGTYARTPRPRIRLVDYASVGSRYWARMNALFAGCDDYYYRPASRAVQKRMFYVETTLKLEAAMNRHRRLKLLTCSECKVMKSRGFDGFHDAQFKAYKFDRVCLACQPHLTNTFKANKIAAFICQYCKQPSELKGAVDVKAFKRVTWELHKAKHPLFSYSPMRYIRHNIKMCSSCYEVRRPALEVTEAEKVKGWRYGKLTSCGRVIWVDEAESTTDFVVQCESWAYCCGTRRSQTGQGDEEA